MQYNFINNLLTYINKNVNICIIQKIMFINIPKKGEVYAA